MRVQADLIKLIQSSVKSDVSTNKHSQSKKKEKQTAHDSKTPQGKIQDTNGLTQQTQSHTAALQFIRHER